MYSNYWRYDFGQIWRQAELNVWNAHNVFDIYFNARGKYYQGPRRHFEIGGATTYIIFGIFF